MRRPICDVCGRDLEGVDFGRITGRGGPRDEGPPSLKVCRPCVVARVADVRIRQGLGDLSDRALLDGVLPPIGKVGDTGPMRWSSLADQLHIDRAGLIVHDAERRHAERNGRTTVCGIHRIVVVDRRCRRCDTAAAGLAGVPDRELCIELIDAQRAGDTTRALEAKAEQRRRREARQAAV